MRNNLFYASPNLSTPELGDYVMMESCVDLEEDRDFTSAAVERRSRRPEREEKKKEFPPPLTTLAMTENQQPFVFRRYHTDDGRLVIVEERVPHCDYFRVTRSDGRLRLELVEIDDVLEEESDDVEEGEGDDVEEEREQCGRYPAVVMGGGKCYDYLRVRSSPCLFEMTVPTVRPVHI